jgi:hypothetical protein
MTGEAPAAYEEKSAILRAGTVDDPFVGVLPRCRIALLRAIPCVSFTIVVIKL